MSSPHRNAAFVVALLLALVSVTLAGTAQAEPPGGRSAQPAMKGRETAQAKEDKFHRFETGQSFLLMSRSRRHLYIKGLVDMIYYAYLQQGSGDDGKEALRTCLDARSARALELRFREYLRHFPKLWDQPAASLFWVTVRRICGVKGIQD